MRARRLRQGQRGDGPYWLAAWVLFALICFALIVFVVPAQAWTLQDCVEVDFDHPDCDRYTTTTTEVPPSTTTSTEPQSTTSTSGQQGSTSTSTTTEPPTVTTTPTDTPTTTLVPQCPPGTIHQPPLCVPVAVPTDTTVEISATSITHNTVVITELPRTGVADLPLLALSLVGLSVLGFTALKYGRRPE